MSLIDTTYKQEIEQLRMCFEDAEKTIKHIEQATFELAIPSVNQLRYVAYHILRASNEKNYKTIEELKEEIKKALHHCQRAKFDAVEIGLTYFLEEVRIFEDTYSHIKETQDVITNYSSYLVDAQSAADELKSIADTEKDRKIYYEKIKPHYEKLKSIVYEFRKAKSLIAVQVEENNKEKIKDTRRFVITITISVIVGIISILALLAKFNIIGSNDHEAHKNPYLEQKNKMDTQGTSLNKNISLE